MSTLGGLADDLDALASWRVNLGAHVENLGRVLHEHELLDEGDRAVLAALRERLDSEKLVLAFVAEFSRGKSELINAIFFADSGRRVLPATPGRTTMCPVELRHEPGQSPRLSLLPIETRLRGLTLAELRPREDVWQHVPLDPGKRESLAQALAAVTRTQRVSVEQATALGLWSSTQPDDNPPRAADGSVEVPTWRHAVIDYPHPLLERGLVVIDTPGLNAVGAEPELTLGLLPSAHAVVFVLSADAGVTRSDLAIWREHLGQASQERFVVLNKIDTLEDPLSTPAEVEEQIEQQRQTVAQTLGVADARIFAVSARDALTARVHGRGESPAAQRLARLERSLTDELLPRRRLLLLQAAVGVVEQLRAGAARRLADRRRQHAEQLLELRGLRGKSGGKLRLLVQRLDTEIAEFEQCASRLSALRSVQLRSQREVLADLSSEKLRSEVATMLAALGPWPFKFGARSAFEAMIARMQSAIDTTGAKGLELQQMLEASFRQLNTDFGFSFVLTPAPELKASREELGSIESSYSRYLGLGQSWRMAAPGFVEQFRRMLLSKLRVCFESAASEFEMWCRSALGQADAQLRDRRRSFARRREALLRVQAASGELEQRIAEVQAQDDAVDQILLRVEALADETVGTARRLAVVQSGATGLPSAATRRDAA